MTDIQFDEEQQYRRPAKVDKKSFLVRLVLATGLVSTNEAAQYALLGVTVVATILAVGIFIYSGSVGSSTIQVPLPPGIPSSYAY